MVRWPKSHGTMIVPKKLNMCTHSPYPTFCVSLFPWYEEWYDNVQPSAILWHPTAIVTLLIFSSDRVYSRVFLGPKKEKNLDFVLIFCFARDRRNSASYHDLHPFWGGRTFFFEKKSGWSIERKLFTFTKRAKTWLQLMLGTVDLIMGAEINPVDIRCS